eukprot:jgi/Tetstr1/422881/TSEL_001293.t1
MVRLCVLGATGNVGAHVVGALLRMRREAAAATEGNAGPLAAATLRLVTRTPEALWARLAERGAGDGVEVVQADVLDPESLASAMAGVDRAFLALPQSLSSEHMEQASRNVADAAKAAGVRVIVRLSSLGIDNMGLQPGQQSQGRLGQSHVKGEAYARECGLALTSVRPTSFSSNFLKYDYEGVCGRRAFASPLGHQAAVNWVTCEDIGAVAAVALADASFDGRVLDVTGPPESTLTAAAMAECLSKAVGSPVAYEEVAPPPMADMQDLWKFLRGGGFDCATTTVEEVTGRTPTSFADFLSSLSFD